MSITSIPIIQIPFPDNQFKKIKTNKNQIVGHHTVGGTAKSSIDWWKSTTSLEGTPIIIDRDGTPYQIFNSQYYAGHIGDTTDERKKFNLPARNCSKYSIGIELASWGGLKKQDNDYINYYGNKVKIKEENIIHYPNGYRKYNYFERYTNAQIQTFKELILYWGDVYKIPLNYNDDIWNIIPRALKGEPGIYSHTSFREDKSDLHPQPELIEMLKSLKG